MLRKGVGTEITVNLKNVHPSKLVAEEFPDKTSALKSEKALLRRRENRDTNRNY